MDKRKRSNPKNKVLQIRCTQEFLDTLDELATAIGSTRTGAIEFAIDLFPTISAEETDDD